MCAPNTRTGRLLAASLSFTVLLITPAHAQSPARLSERFLDSQSARSPSSAMLAGTVFLGMQDPETPDGSATSQEPSGDSIQTDRPDFTESSANIARGRLQIESGYTYNYDKDDGVRTRTHGFPEILGRIGLTDELELRIGWNYFAERTRGRAPGTRDTVDGAADLYLGLGVALREQCGWMPEAKINLQTTVPTGADAFSSDKLNPGFNLLYGWEVTDFIAMGASTGVNTVSEDDDDLVQFHQSFTVGYSLSEQLGAYTEWFGLYRVDSASNVPQNFFNGGFTYKVTNDVQFDIRAGVGLNDNAADFFSGIGLSVRY